MPPNPTRASRIDRIARRRAPLNSGGEQQPCDFRTWT
jgi:hypothetical protein